MKRFIVFIMAVALLQGASAQKFSVRKHAEKDTLRVKPEMELSLGDRYYRHHVNEITCTAGAAVLGALSSYLMIDGFNKNSKPMYISGIITTAASLVCTGFAIDAYMKKGKVVRIGLNKVTVTF